jgi:chromosome segregation ATPase
VKSQEAGMKKKNTAVDNSSPSFHTENTAIDIVQDFNETVKVLGEAKNSLEREIIDLRKEMENLYKEKDMVETDLCRSKEVSEIAMSAKASEDEKQDALKKNQELRSYLDSAAEKIKSINIKFAEEANEVKRLQARIEALETEKISMVKDTENLRSKMLGMKDMITEQDFKIRNLALQLETSQDDKKSLEKELASTKKALDDIQKSMASIKDKMRMGDINKTLQAT